MYSTELDKLRREKEAQRSRAERLEDQASALQVAPVTVHHPRGQRTTSLSPQTSWTSSPPPPLQSC